MASDITWCVERRTASGWERAEPWVPKAIRFRDDDRSRVRWVAYGGRDYELFGLLAAVRARDEPFWPLKGAPDDMSDETRTQFEGYGADAHSASSLTIRELLEFDWDSDIEMDAWTDDRYPDGRPGRAAVLQAIAREDRSLPLEFAGRPGRAYPAWSVSHGKLISWNQPWLQGRQEFAQCLVVVSVWARGDLDSVRAVFWFDN